LTFKIAAQETKGRGMTGGCGRGGLHCTGSMEAGSRYDSPELMAAGLLYRRIGV